MTHEEAITILKYNLNVIHQTIDGRTDPKEVEALDMAIKALEKKPYEKFESVKDHICKLASDYKCWDNRLTDDEALELAHKLEQEPCKKDVIHMSVIEDIKAEIKEEQEYAYADFDEYNNEILGFDDTDVCERDLCCIGLGRALQIINKHISRK